MNRKIAKLIRGFCKVTNKPYREMKRGYLRLSPEKRRDAKQQLLEFWDENEKMGYVHHKNYYELKESLETTLRKRNIKG